MNEPRKILLCSKKNVWSQRLFDKLLIKLPINCNIAWATPNEIDLKTTINAINPEKIFFFHWSDYIPENIFNNYECITMHTSNLPYGRGGTPLQNQIIDKITFTKVNALRTSDGMDVGPIYCDKSISLQGTITDIWLTIADAAVELIEYIITNNIVPKAQELVIQSYKRRKSTKVNLAKCKTITDLYDIIRMLDGEGYPKAYIDIDDFKIEFSRASLNSDGILADVKITKIDDDN
jgi:methionyl-tRNA formyltransferase